MWSSMTSEILAEIHARSAEEPGAELFCRRTSSGLTARCIEGPVRQRQQEDVAAQQRLNAGLPSSEDGRAVPSSSSSSSSSCIRAVHGQGGGGNHRAAEGRETTPWERSVETKVPPHFTTTGSRRLVHPAPLHIGHQPPNEPALPLHRHDDWEAVREKDGGAGQPCAGDGSTANDGKSQARKSTEGWIPAHEVYNDMEEVPSRQRHATDLHFESRFESGNLASAVRLSALEYNLYLRPDKGSGGCQWYYFMVSNMKKECAYKFNIMHFYKEKSMYHHGMRPLLWSQKDSQRHEQLGWRRAGSQTRYYENGVKKKNGGRNFTLSFEIEFDHEDDVCFIAMCYPFTYSDLSILLLEVEHLAQKRRIITRRELCKTEGGVACEILTICNPRPPSQVERRPVFFISGRVHPGESNASYIVKGILQFLVSDEEIARELCEHFVFEVIPMLNPDGVIHGHYRVSLSGDDLNRNWTEPSKDRHPTIYYGKKRLKALAGEGRLLLYCDVHGHSTKKNVFMYGCNSSAFGFSQFGAVDMHQKGYRREQQFPKLFSQRWPCVSFKDCSFEVDKKKENTGRAAVARECALIHSYTLEASFCGSNLHQDDSEDSTLTHFTAEDLEKTGMELCKALAAYVVEQDHGWELEENVKPAMRQALLSDGPPPGASVLDLYYENLKKCEHEKAISRKNTLADIVADVMTMGAGSYANLKSYDESAGTSNASGLRGMNCSDTPEAPSIHRSFSDPALSNRSLFCESPLNEIRADFTKSRGHGVRSEFRHQRLARPRRKHDVSDALAAVFGASPSEESTSPLPKGEILQLKPMDPTSQQAEETLFFMTEKERRKKEEQEPGVKFVAHRESQGSASPSRNTSTSRRSPSRTDMSRGGVLSDNVFTAGSMQSPQTFLAAERERKGKVLVGQEQHQQQQMRASLGEGITKYVRISHSRLNEMRDSSSGALLHDALPPVSSRQDTNSNSSSKSQRRSPRLGAAGWGWLAARGASGSGSQHGNRGGRQGGREGGGVETSRHRGFKTSRSGAASADVPETHVRLLQQSSHQTTDELISFKRTEEQILNRLHRIVNRGSNGVEISSPITSQAAPRLVSASPGFRKSGVLRSASFGSGAGAFGASEWQQIQSPSVGGSFRR